MVHTTVGRTPHKITTLHSGIISSTPQKIFKVKLWTLKYPSVSPESQKQPPDNLWWKVADKWASSKQFVTGIPDKKSKRSEVQWGQKPRCSLLSKRITVSDPDTPKVSLTGCRSLGTAFRAFSVFVFLILHFLFFSDPKKKRFSCSDLRGQTPFRFGFTQSKLKS